MLKRRNSGSPNVNHFTNTDNTFLILQKETASNLVERLEELESYEVDVRSGLLALNPRRDRWRLRRNRRGCGRGRGRDCQADHLPFSEMTGTGNKGARRADVQGLGELEKLSPSGINPAKKNGYLQSDARRSPPLSGLQSLPLFFADQFQTHSLTPQY